ncbi:MAG: type II toxin-antitoxin system RelE/ParE family toxin [Rhodospirillales bacterium]|nr:type II toxin-antitoxin system RelE/ParE family toxin [Rhodospirillales bacterium]
MSLRWRLSAVSDLTNIRDYISEDDPEAARAVVERVLRSIDRLESFPRSGRAGQVLGTRELVVPGLPYIVVYTCDDTDISIIGVFHGARDRR